MGALFFCAVMDTTVAKAYTSVARYAADTETYAYSWCQGFESGVPTGSQDWTFNQHCTFAADPAGGFAVMDNLTYNPDGEVRIDYWDILDLPYTPGKNLGNTCNCIGDPIAPATGNEFKDEQDASLGDLSFHRFYNSHPAVVSTHIGNNWRHTFDRSVVYSLGSDPSTATVYRADGHWFTFTLASGQWTTDPDVADRLAEQTDGSGNPTGWLYFDAATRDEESYDQNGDLLSITDIDGFVTTLAYSTTSTPSNIAPTAGLLLTVTDPRGRILSFTYNSNSQVATVTDPDGSMLAYTYNSNGNLTSVIYPGQTSRTYVYNESSMTGGANLPNALTGEIDEANIRYASIGYNTEDQATMSMLAANIDETQISYGSGGATTVAYPAGVQAKLGFVNPNGTMRISTASNPCAPGCDQTAASRSYDANGYPATSTDFNGITTAYTYDAQGLETQRVEAQGTLVQRTINTSWDTVLRNPLERTVLDVSGTLTAKTDWVYNSRGQVLARCEDDPTTSGATSYVCANIGKPAPGVRRWTYAYCDTVGSGCPLISLLLSVDGPRTDVSDVKQYAYYPTTDESGCATVGGACHHAGDLWKVTNALGHVTTTISYDKNGRPTETIDANGVVTTLSYMPRGWLHTRSVAGATTTIDYDAVGNVTKVTQPMRVHQLWL